MFMAVVRYLRRVCDSCKVNLMFCDSCKVDITLLLQ